MIQWLFLNRVDAKPAGAAIGGQHHRITHPLAHEAQPLLPCMQLAFAWTQIALDAPIRQGMPPLRRVRRSFVHLRRVRRGHDLTHGISAPRNERA